MTQLIRNTERNRYPSVFGSFFDELFRDLAVDQFPAESVTKSFRTTQKDGEYLLSLDLPGVAKENAHVDIDNGILTVRAERKGHWESKFERSFSLPTSVDVEKIEAQMENGVLNIVLPKLAASKARKIEIGSGSNANWNKLSEADKTAV